MSNFKLEVSGEDAGKVHIDGMDAHDMETFCGKCWSGALFEVSEGPVTCPQCVRAAREARRILRGVRLPT